MCVLDESDYQAIRSSNPDVFITLSGSQRRGCFEVSIVDDIIVEEIESFKLSLSLDVFVPQGVQDQVTLDPSEVYVNIISDDGELCCVSQARSYAQDTTTVPSVF